MKATTRFHDLTSTVALVTACLVFGAAIGWMSVYLFAAEPVPGWAGVRRATGELVIGGVLGGLVGIYLARDIPARARWWSTGVAMLLAAGTLWSLALTEPPG